MREYRGKRWERFGDNLVIYNCISPDFSKIAVDEVFERDGKIYYRQVYPKWHVYLTSIRGYYGSLGKRAAEELQKELENREDRND